ncbi:MAG: RNase adapter RapZ [Coriobacteriales bacterium]
MSDTHPDDLASAPDGSERDESFPDAEQEESADSASGPDLIVITGMSGAGRTEALHTFEDLGYFCIDNLPPQLIINLVSLAGMQSREFRRLAIVCDLRTKELFPKLIDELHHLDELGISYTMLFLDASDEVLLRRFKTNRRRHPMCSRGMTISAGIKKERGMLSAVREIANHVVDTSDMTSQALRTLLRDMYTGGEAAERNLTVTVFSFGFKHGTPYDADLLIDVRFLPNPFYVKELRHQTGLDEEVYDYVMSNEDTRHFLDAWFNLLDTVMPGYVREGKQQLAIAIGCTGGQHRSVVISRATGEHLKAAGYLVEVTHRDIALAET